MIYTASFFEQWNYGQERLVSIAIEKPFERSNGREIYDNELLMPTWTMVRSRKAGIMTVEEYTRAYRRMLRGLLYKQWDIFNGKRGPEATLEDMVLKDEDTLLCWEKYGQFCHRIIVAELLEKNGIKVRRK